MKKIVFIMATAVALMSTGCETHDLWDDGLPEMEHVYYVGFYKTNIYTDYLSYEIDQNGNAQWKFGATAIAGGIWEVTDEQWVATIPIQFYSERVRTYDAVTYFWVFNIDGSALTVASDYTVTLENGAALTPNANGAYSLTWLQTKKGIQNVKIKRSETAPTGTLRVSLYDPAKPAPLVTDLSTTIQNQTAEYEIRCFTHDNDRVTVSFTEYVEPEPDAIDVSKFTPINANFISGGRIHFEDGQKVTFAGISEAELALAYNRDFFIPNGDGSFTFDGPSGEYDVFYSPTWIYFSICRLEDEAPDAYWIRGAQFTQCSQWNGGPSYSWDTGAMPYVKPLGDGKFQVTLYLMARFDFFLRTKSVNVEDNINIAISSLKGDADGFELQQEGLFFRDAEAGGMIAGNYRLIFDNTDNSLTIVRL